VYLERVPCTFALFSLTRLSDIARRPLAPAPAARLFGGEGGLLAKKVGGAVDVEALARDVQLVATLLGRGAPVGTGAALHDRRGGERPRARAGGAPPRSTRRHSGCN